MDTNTPLVPGRSKREMKYHRCAIEPGDTELLDQLKAEHREVLFSRGTYQERAQALNIPVGTVRSRLHRARPRWKRFATAVPSSTKELRS